MGDQSQDQNQSQNQDEDLIAPHVLIQLISPFLQLEEVIKFRLVCKSWCKLLTEMYPKLHKQRFDREFIPEFGIGKNYAICMKEIQNGRFRLYPNRHWFIYLKDAKVPLPLPIKFSKLVQLIANKYEPEMWDKYWERHHDKHQESGKSKCLRYEIPEIGLIIFEVLGRKIKMRAILEAEGKRRRGCFESCGNINVDF